MAVSGARPGLSAGRREPWRIRRVAEVSEHLEHFDRVCGGKR